MRNILILLALLFSVSAIAQVHAYFMVTTTNTTVILSPNNSAHVIDTINIFISNSSEQQYIQDRAAVNPTIGDWEAALQISGIQEHIINPKLSIHSFTLLPGPLRYTSNGAIAYLTMDYYVNNITTVSNIGPRKVNECMLDFGLIIGSCMPLICSAASQSPIVGFTAALSCMYCCSEELLMNMFIVSMTWALLLGKSMTVVFVVVTIK